MLGTPVTEGQYLEMVQTAASMALQEIELDSPNTRGSVVRELTGMLLRGYPNNTKDTFPKFGQFTPNISEQTWRKIAIATGFINQWANGATKDFEQVCLHIEVRCLMAIDTIAMYFENGQPDIVQPEERKDAVAFCFALHRLHRLDTT